MIYTILLVTGFSVGCVLTWLSMCNTIDTSYTAGYAQGFHDAKQGVNKDA